MNSDPLKKAFSRVKEDIFTLQSQISELAREIRELKRTLSPTDKPTDRPTHPNLIQTEAPISPTNPQENDPKTPISSISTGNGGVPTDRQTNQQTDRHIQKFAQSPIIIKDNDKISEIERVSEIVSSFDSLKKDLRQKLKKLTSQEMLVFSTVYQLSEEGLTVDYPLLANKLSLTESSIRDYVLKLIKKGVPLEKSKENNKKITLTIPQDFKRIASLSTIISLREL